MATWHCTYLPHGLFPLLGERFVRRWHATYLDLPHGVALVAELERAATTTRVGFLIGATDHVDFVETALRRHRLQLAGAGVIALLVRPRVLAHFLRTRARPYLRRLFSAAPSGRRLDHAAKGGGHVAVLSAIAVDPVARSAGVGSALVTEFLQQASTAGAREALLTTRVGDSGAGPFYEAHGWQAVDTHQTRDTVTVATYRMTLPHDDQPPA